MLFGSSIGNGAGCSVLVLQDLPCADTVHQCKPRKTNALRVFADASTSSILIDSMKYTKNI